MKRNSDKYIVITKKEGLFLIGKSMAVVLILDYFFYKALIYLLPLGILGFLFFLRSYRELMNKKRYEATVQFRELLLLSCTYLKAGYSVENAMLGSYRDMERLYSGESFIVRLLLKVKAARDNNRPGYLVFGQIGHDGKIPVIEEFAKVYRIAYESSGNLTEVMEKCAQSIVEKLEAENEIQKMLNERIFELKIMSVMPFLIIEYMSLVNKGYFDVMYEGLLGRGIMSICLLIYVGAYAWGCRITAVKI